MKKLPIKKTLQYSLLAIIGSSITIYFFLSSFEILFNRPIPFLGSVGYFQDSQMFNSIIAGKVIKYVSSGYAILAKGHLFTQMDIPRLQAKINVIPAIKQGNKWIYRANSMQYFFLARPNMTDPSFIVMYLDRNWRSIADPGKLQLGDSLFVQRDDDTAILFRIKDKKILDFNATYVPTDGNNTNMILIIEDRPNRVSYIYEAESLIDTSNSLI